MTEQDAIRFLTAGDNLCVPCSRYGRDSFGCARVAYVTSNILMAETGAPPESERESLDYIMGLVVNDHDDPEYLIREYGPSNGIDPEEYLD